MLFSSKEGHFEFHTYNSCLLYIMSQYAPIIITLSPLVPSQHGRKNSGTDLGTGYGGTVCGFHTQPFKMIWDGTPRNYGTKCPSMENQMQLLGRNILGQNVSGAKHPRAALSSRKASLTTIPFFTFALAGCLQSFHPTHAQLSNRNGKFVFSGTFHIMWVEVGQDILLNRSIFLNKSDQLCINIT